jgi:hypothetical protein
MHKILALWAVPRSTSTAFEWMMRQRGDMKCFHEPFGEAWYQGEAPRWPRVTADSVRTPRLTPDTVLATLKKAASRGPVFSKDFPHYIAEIWTDELLDNPHAMVECWCNAVQIPFLPSALSWEPGARDEVSWWDGGSFHADLRDSDGFSPQPRKYVDIAETPDRVKRIYEMVLPHYEHMFAHRLRIPQAAEVLA